WTARYYLVSLAEVIGTIVPSRLPDPSAERIVALVRRLSDADGDALARRAPARSLAYRLLAASPEGWLSLRDVRASGAPADAVRGLGRAGTAESRRVPRAGRPARAPPGRGRVTLTAEQQRAADALAEAVRGGVAASFVLHGVTGSGKTEVFLTAVEE